MADEVRFALASASAVFEASETSDPLIQWMAMYVEYCCTHSGLLKGDKKWSILEA